MIVSDPVSHDDPPLPVVDPPSLADEVRDKNPMVALDQEDEKYRTTKLEIWAYYACVTSNPTTQPLLNCDNSYYAGNNGLSLFSMPTSRIFSDPFLSNEQIDFAPTAFQNLLYQAAGESNTLSFAGSPRSINGIVLLCNGISFAVQIVVFLVIGSFADFGNWRPNILIMLSIVAYALGFAWLGIHTGDKWHIGAGLYIIGLIAYQTTLTFWTAAFPGLARNTPEMKDHADDLAAGKISREEYDFADTMKRSQLANIAFYIQSLAEIIILAIIVGLMFKIDVNASEVNNNWGLSVLIAFASGVWLLVSLPWFFLEKRRPGLNQGKRSIILAGLSQLSYAMSQVWKLKQSMLYLIGKREMIHSLRELQTKFFLRLFLSG